MQIICEHFGDNVLGTRWNLDSSKQFEAVPRLNCLNFKFSFRIPNFEVDLIEWFNWINNWFSGLLSGNSKHARRFWLEEKKMLVQSFGRVCFRLKAASKLKKRCSSDARKRCGPLRGAKSLQLIVAFNLDFSSKTLSLIANYWAFFFKKMLPNQFEWHLDTPRSQ